VTVVASERGLRQVTFDAVEPGEDWIDDPDLPAAVQLREYFAGTRRSFDVALDAAGTPFQRAVWDALLTVPYGRTTTYGEVAARLGRPTASRAVGAANGQNPIAIIVPCHRVIGASGALTGYAGGLDRKRLLLGLERGGELFGAPAP
jgi:methylated-DNA-[protein]-cysteine S-methyltransferase